MTDEQLAEAFPGQDVASIRASMEKAEGKGVAADDNADDDSGNDDVVYPDYIPEKYRNGTVEEAHAAMAKGYDELNTKLGASDDDTDDGDGDADTDADDSNDDDSDDSTSNKLMLADLETEYLENDGEISQKTLDAWEKQGWGKAEVDNYIAGQQALADQLITRVHNQVGGEEQYTQMLNWATNNWTPEEVEGFDKVMVEGDEAQITLAVRGLKATFEAEAGKDPTLLNGDTDQGADKSGTYQSKAEMTKAMADPRYKTDPAYRAMVARKVEHMEW
jgi:hypothetical protein